MTRHYSRESLDRLYGMLKDDLPLRAVVCLLDHGRDPRFALYTRARAAAKRGGTTQFLTEAANLEPEIMALLVANGARVKWMPISASEERYRGPVYSLDVEVHHTYISDGVVTHNCIYSFTGASPDAILDPDIPDDHKIILKQSYRVPRTVHALADTFIRQVARRQKKIYLPRSAEGKVERFSRDGYKRIEYEILKTALEHLDQGKTVMFLASCSYMLHPVVAVLRKNGIPFHNPYRSSSGFWNPLRLGRRGASANRILALLVAHPNFGEGRRDWTHEDLALWADCLYSKGILKDGAKKKFSTADASSPVTIGSLDAIFETAALESLLEAFEGDHRALLAWWRDRVTADVRKRIQFPADVAAARGPQALREVPKVIVGTIHSVKGGEADVVFLFPDLSQAGDAQYRRDGPTRDSVIRVFYVGMTRARETLYLCQRESTMAVSI